MRLVQALKKYAYAALVAILSMLNFFLGYEAGSFQLAADNIASEFNVSTVGMGLLIGAQYAAVMLGPLVLGARSDIIGKRRTMLISIPLFCVGCLVCALSNGTASFIIGVLTLGIGFSVTESVTAAILADSDASRADRAINAAQLFFGLGAVLSPLIGSTLMERGVSWRAGFFTCAMGYAVLLPLFSLLPYRDTPRAQAPSLDPTAQKLTKPSPYSLLTQVSFVMLLLSIMLYVGNEAVVVYYAETLFAVELGAPRFGAYAISAFWLVMSASRLLFCLIKTDTRKTLLTFRILFTLCLFAIALVDSPVLLLIVFVLTGAAAGPTWPLLMSLAARENPDRPGAASSLMGIGSGIGGSLLSVAMGALVGAFGCQAAFLACAILNLLLAAVLSYVEKRQARAPSPQA